MEEFLVEFITHVCPLTAFLLFTGYIALLNIVSCKPVFDQCDVLLRDLIPLP